MKKSFFIGFVLFCLISCEKQPENTEYNSIAGITMKNYPWVDGSTSTDPLNYIIAAKLLGLEYEWLGGISIIISEMQIRQLKKVSMFPIKKK